MSLIISNKIDSNDINNIPFCDKNFKYARFSADYAGTICTLFFCKVIAMALALDFTEHFSGARRYYLLSAESAQDKIIALKNQYKIFKKYENEIIDFAQNGGTSADDTILKAFDSRDPSLSMTKAQMIESPASRSTELSVLKHMYGEATVNELFRQFGEQPKQYLSRSKMLQGCCLAMSQDFISSYLRQTRSGKSSLNAVKAIAPKYVNGASEKAQIEQIFYSATVAERRDFYTREITAIFDLRNNKVYTTNECATRLKQLKQLAHQNRLRNFETISTAFGLIAESNAVQKFAVPIFEDSEFQKFQTFIQNLPPGAYQIDLDNSANPSGHTIAFIKTQDGDDFIFDPNFGTLKVDKTRSCARLWMLAQLVEHNEFTFTPFALQA